MSNPKATIPIVIVESHQHVLEHIHDMLRKKKLFNKSWSMVHFDAHPDLACSKSVPAAAFFNPRQYYHSTVVNEELTKKEEEEKNLYELLDLTPSGIAEWILPLVLAAKLNKIQWIKPSFSSQISEGTYRYTVGVEHESVDHRNEISYLDLPPSARIKVSFHHPYYLDDSSVVSSNEQLVLKQNLELRVLELRSKECEEEKLPNGVDFSGEKVSNTWILDICLDYFLCHNPYISDLESRNAAATRAFLNVMKSSKFNNNKSIDNNNTSLRYQTDIIRFYDLLRQLLLDNLKEEQGNSSPTKRTKHDGSDSCYDKILKYFELPAEKLIQQLITEINNDDKDSAQLCSMIIEAIPNWSMPHKPDKKDFEDSLYLVESYIKRHLQKNGKPFLITIARSTDDGFCPPQMVEILQQKVLDILEKQLDLLLVRDYGEWEGSVIPHT